MMMAVCSFCRAKEAYAVYDPSNRSLFFYYDNKRSEIPSSKIAYDLPTNDDTPDWILYEKKIRYVEFNYTFADYRPTTTYKWFYNLQDLTSITGIDYLKTDNVTNMSYMFYRCYRLSDLTVVSDWTVVNVGGWNTSNVTDMSWMFDECYILKSLDVSNWDTGKVTNMKAMFAECKELKSLDLRKWDTSNVTDMSWMFYYCNCFENNFPLNSWNTEKVTNMSGMFSHCMNVDNIELSEWNTSNVTDMSYMFCQCYALTSLDLSGWDTGKVTDMQEMFSMFPDGGDLKVIFVGSDWSTGKVSSSVSMFDKCTKLVGGSGTGYNSSHTDATYARIDGGTTSPGYFSSNEKEYDLKIAGTTVNKSNMSDVLGNGIFSYSPSTKTLTVKGSYTSSDPDIISSSINGLTINVTKDAVLANDGARSSIWLNKNTTIKGEGKLTLKSNDNPGIYLTDGASATIENMNMDIEAFWGISGPFNPTGEKITIKSSNITIITSTVGNQYSAAICDLSGGIILEDCSITYPTNATIQNNGVYSGTKLAKDVTITAKGNIATGIENGQRNSVKGQRDEWFTLDGQKLSGKPTQKGIYIQNGKKRIIK